MRKIKIEQTELLEILHNKKDLSIEAEPLLDEMRKIDERKDELEQEFNKIISKQARNDERAKPLIDEIYKDIEVAEFEEIGAVREYESGDWYIEIADRMEEFKEKFKKDQEEKRLAKLNETAGKTEVRSESDEPVEVKEEATETKEDGSN